MDQTKEEIQKRFTPFEFLCRGRETGRLAGVGVAARSPEDRVAVLLEPQLARPHKGQFPTSSAGYFTGGVTCPLPDRQGRETAEPSEKYLPISLKFFFFIFFFFSSS